MCGILPMEKTVSRIVKIGELKHMKSFYENGDMCFNTVECFNKWDKNKERYDTTEGADEINQIDWLKIVSENGETFEFLKTDKSLHRLKSSFISKFSDDNKGNIFSCVGINPENLNNFQKLNPKFLSFGDTLVLITKPSIFFDKVSGALRKKGFEFEIGYVTYYSVDSINGKWNVFSKLKNLEYQSEIRIWIKSEIKERLILNIGSIKDISKIFSIRSSKTK